MRARLSACVALLLLSTFPSGPTGTAELRGPEPRAALASFGKLPLHFEENQGQAAAPVLFLARGAGYTLFLTATESVLALRRHAAASSVVRVSLLGANPRPVVGGKELLPGKSHYFVGNDRRRWRTNVPQYARVEYAEVYPGVNLTYHGNQSRLEYDFVLDPGADPSVIRLGIEGAQALRTDADGNLRIGLEGGELVQHAPAVYQEVGGTRKAVSGRFIVNKHEVAFRVGAYDKDRTLVLDPVLSYSTYLGGSNVDHALDIAVDASGNAYVTGDTASIDFPTQDPMQAANAGNRDAFVSKLNSAGSALVYSTYLGGSGEDFGFGIAVDASGETSITGQTDSTDFPTVNPIQPANGGAGDAFVARLNASGTALVYSTYLGGSGADTAQEIALESGNVSIAGVTTSSDFPTFNPIQPSRRGPSDAFVTQLDPTGSAFVFSTYLGGSGDDVGTGIAMQAGNVFVTGRTTSEDFPTRNPFQGTKGAVGDAFVSKLDPSGSSLVYSTFLGGNGSDSGLSIAVDAPGNAYVGGLTASTDFPTLKPFQASFHGGSDDAFITKLNPEGSALVYSSYLGGSGGDAVFAIAVAPSGNVMVTGRTTSSDFPTRNALQPLHGGSFDAFVARLKPRVTGGPGLDYSTYLGGSLLDVGFGIATDASESAYVVGNTSSANFPTHNAFQPENAGAVDLFVSKIQ